jgi:hypothetical protein
MKIGARIFKVIFLKRVKIGLVFISFKLGPISIPGHIKPKTINLMFVASMLST